MADGEDARPSSGPQAEDTNSHMESSNGMADDNLLIKGKPTTPQGEESQRSPSEGDRINAGSSLAQTPQAQVDMDEENASPRPSSKSTSRMPKISSRAAFTRTPSHMLTPSIDDDGLPTQDEMGVLITELQIAPGPAEQASDTEDLDETLGEHVAVDKADEIDRESQADVMEGDDKSIISEPCELPLQTAPVDTVEVRVADDDYDTDLEVEEQEDEEVVQAYYKTCCEQLGLVPVEYFLRNIRSPNIRMRYRGLGPDATRAIALSLKDNITLERLDIGGNWIGAEGARYMSRLLEENDYITDIGMSENKIGSEGCLHVAKMIHINGSLRRLDLSGK